MSIFLYQIIFAIFATNYVVIIFIFMRKLLLFFMIFTLSAVVNAQTGGMTDSQVVEYVKAANAAGASKQEIYADLLKKGVSKEQLIRIKSRYDNKSKTDNASEIETGGVLRERNKLHEGRITGMLPVPEDDKQIKIFGHNLFNSKELTFEPNINMATPENYVLGPGDEVVINIWGASENTIRQTISPEGTINVSGLGPVQLSGFKISDANKYLQEEFSKIYGVGGDDPNSQIRLTLGNNRTILVNIMGEVGKPGSYMLSSFATVFNALYNAGGINNIGTLRSVIVVRSGKVVADIDVYEYIINGKTGEDIRLNEGDVIIVKPYSELVKIKGKVKRPMFYEMKPGETISDLIYYAGGFEGDAYRQAVSVTRRNGEKLSAYNVIESYYSKFDLLDKDEVVVGGIIERFNNRIAISGAVNRPGNYDLCDKISTVKQLVEAAGGVRGDAFLNRAILSRELPDYSRKLISIPLGGIIDGSSSDVKLMVNDSLSVAYIDSLRELRTVSIFGEIINPGTYDYSENTNIEDLIILAGGLKEDASAVRVEVSRRLKEPYGEEYSEKLGDTFCFEISNGLVVGGEEFKLQPFDAVYIRKSPTYRKQKNVSISGEVLFGGEYGLVKKNERLSDLVKRSGGLTPNAYIEGARLLREQSKAEKARKDDVLKLAKNQEGKDSISVEKLDLSERYTVGIDLKKALKYPGSDYDLVLREGDQLFVPGVENTVKISGAVMYPNTVVYKKGAGLKYYIDQAGGYGSLARKKHVYSIQMNGMVARLSRHSSSSKIQPGCEIIVPSKEEHRRMSTAEVLSMGSTMASIAAVIATIINVTK